jgi:RNA polymerase sigma factor (sigma-70 family)
MTTFALSSAGSLDDATLARAAATGDRAAFAAIYDRYADRLYDFCVGMLRDRDSAADCVQDVFVTAATKLVQLREPDRLRSWLYAIARSEALARIRDRKREMPSEELPDMPTAEADLATMAARNELAALIAEASGGLSDRDRLVLELAYRQGLDGPELADALGVTHKNANTLVERLRDTIARSLGALLVCRRVKADPSQCPELAEVLVDWDGKFTVLMRKRIARHIDGCAVCEEDRAQLVSPAALLGAAPIALPAPVWLRDRTLQHATLPGPSAAPPSGESWWPEADVDVSDLGEHPATASTPSATLRRGVRVGLGAALVALTVGAALVLATPSTVRVTPVNDPQQLVTTTATPVTTTPSAVPRIAPPPSEPPPPPVVTTTAAEVAPTTEAPPPSPEAPKRTAPHTTEPTQEPITTEPAPTSHEPPPSNNPPAEPEPEPEPDEPTTPPTPKSKPPVISQAPEAPKQSPECPPLNPNCNGGGPVFS